RTEGRKEKEVEARHGHHRSGGPHRPAAPGGEPQDEQQVGEAGGGGVGPGEASQESDQRRGEGKGHPGRAPPSRNRARIGGHGTSLAGKPSKDLKDDRDIRDAAERAFSPVPTNLLQFPPTSRNVEEASRRARRAAFP